MNKARSKIREANLIAIAGKQYAGKDFLTRLLLERLPGFRQVPLALAIKTAYAEQHGLTLPELEADKARHRAGLIALGNEGRMRDPDCWIRQVLAMPKPKIVSDLRLKREYDVLREHGAFLIRLEVSREIRTRRGHLGSEADPTETELDSVSQWDAVLVNEASEDDLRRQVKALFDASV